MAEVLLFHHVHGLTDGVRAFADHLRGAGRAVRVPDLYDGRTLTSIGDGFEFQKSVSGEELADADVYPGDQHLFPDRSLPSNDAGAAALLTQRVVAFLDRF
jgi:dienelactone hydrolase